MSKSTPSSRRGKATAKTKAKPEKPRPDFPLYAHASGRWAKRIKGRICYFGPWSDPDGALERYLDQKDDLYAGRVPREHRDGLTVLQMCTRFLERKEQHLQTGEIVERTFLDYRRTCKRMVRVFGKNRLVEDLQGDDFAKLRNDIAKTFGAIATGNEIQKVRTVFKWAWDEGLVKAPVRYGQSFDKPNRRILREARNRRAARMFEAEDIKRLIDNAGVHLRAMIFLGVNGGFGNSDCEQLPIEALDLKTGWIDFPRPKTAVARRFPLWPETIEALEASIARRPIPKNEADDRLVFITKYGSSWHKAKERGPVVLQFRRLLDDLGLHKPGRGFYSLRHVFETIGGETLDQVAVNAIMGHVDESMAANYRERISNDRLQQVVNHVRNWLFGTAGETADDFRKEAPSDARGVFRETGSAVADGRPALRLFAG